MIERALVLGFRLARHCLTRESPALGSANLLALVPSLEAKYRPKGKRCQEKFGFEPQNIWYRVTGSSTCSGACAGHHNGVFAANLLGKTKPGSLWKSSGWLVQK
jgi:hypothetical protein